MQNERENRTIIIGAGIAGLTAAIELEKSGHKVVILEADSKIGGRVQTDIFDGFLLDHGFQVLLTAYPEVNRYLDLHKLDLHYFDPGAIIYSGGSHFNISDPLRQPSQLLNMVLSPVGTLRDKYLIWKLGRTLKQTSVKEIFLTENKSTKTYLEDYGFSRTMITNFFKPFFGGIFLESELSTSIRMFQFVFKMFGEGQAAVPSRGMGVIPEFLSNQLKNTEIKLNTKVNNIQSREIALENGEKILFDKLIIATNHEGLLDTGKRKVDVFESVLNIYFATPEKKINKRLIALVPGNQNLVNNFCVISDTIPSYAPADMALISVSINGDRLSGVNDPLGIARTELSQLVGYDPGKLRHLKSFEISRALPKVENMVIDLPSDKIKINENIYLAGDYLLNASLNAAMTSGRIAAQAVMNQL
jgi:protoporphyrinogen oxidase